MRRDAMVFACGGLVAVSMGTGCSGGDNAGPADAAITQNGDGQAGTGGGGDAASTVDATADGGGTDAATTADGSTSIATLTAATLFRVDSTGANLGTNGSAVGHGVWSSLAGVQNIPGNYGGHLFLSPVATPTSSDFLAISTPLTVPLHSGDNTLYFFANGDDMLGGTFGFGVNLWFAGAGASTPGISAFVAAPAEGGTFAADGTKACTAGYDDQCYPGAQTLSATQGGARVTLTALAVTAIGGASASSTTCVDRVGGNNTAPTVVDAPDGICDTTGTLTLTLP